MPEIQPLPDDMDGPQRANAGDRDEWVSYSPSTAFYVLTIAHLPRKIFNMLQKLFDLLQNSTIANRESADPKQQFWKRYRAVAEAFDNEFLKRYRDDMDVSMIFVSDIFYCES